MSIKLNPEIDVKFTFVTKKKKNKTNIYVCVYFFSFSCQQKTNHNILSYNLNSVSYAPLTTWSQLGKRGTRCIIFCKYKLKTKRFRKFLTYKKKKNKIKL